MNENNFGKGGIIENKVVRYFKKKSRPSIGMAGIPFDWGKGFHTRPLVNPKIKDQNGSYSCGGQMKSYGRAISKAIRKKTPYVEESAKASYEPIAAVGGGATVSNVKKYQTFPESQVNSYENGLPPSESFMTDPSWRKGITLLPDDWVPHNIEISLEGFAQAVRDYGYVYVLFRGQNNGTWTTINPRPPIKSLDKDLWGHYVCGEGADMVQGERAFYFYQSWGERVGDKGVQCFKQDYFDSGCIIDAFVMAPPADPTPAVINDNSQIIIPAPIWANGTVINWYQRWVAMLKKYGIYQGK